MPSLRPWGIGRDVTIDSGSVPPDTEPASSAPRRSDSKCHIDQQSRKLWLTVTTSPRRAKSGGFAAKGSANVSILVRLASSRQQTDLARAHLVVRVSPARGRYNSRRCGPQRPSAPKRSPTPRLPVLALPLSTLHIDRMRSSELASAASVLNGLLHLPSKQTGQHSPVLPPRPPAPRLALRH